MVEKKKKKQMSRREILRVGSIGAAGLTLAACASTEAPTEAPAEATGAPEPTSPPPAGEKVALEVMALAEYEASYQELWNVF
ncbi:MAG TPA: hypothetical protein VFI27_15555, partial [candidate division Zixibacteria bacterium]|nr:hypothetical protein [candidate division Zixibacteria bacterium]